MRIEAPPLAAQTNALAEPGRVRQASCSTDEPIGEAEAEGLRAALDDKAMTALLQAISRQDEPALAALYAATAGRVYGVALQLVRRPALAEEVVEATYFQVWRQASRFDPARGHPMGWLLSMSRSRAIDAIRQESRSASVQVDPEDLPELSDLSDPSEGKGADRLLEASRHHALLHQTLLQLQAQPRQLLALAFFRGLSHQEISQQTSLPLGTVKSQIRRALLQLKPMLSAA